MTHEEKKIIIDEDWKTQVQAEKEAMARKPSVAPTAEPAADQPAPAPSAQESLGPLPEPTLTDLVTMLGTQAMIALSTYADPKEGKKPEQLEQAKYFIDMLAVLEAKTQGNRTPEEISLLSQSLHELRMGYVAVQK